MMKNHQSLFPSPTGTQKVGISTYFYDILSMSIFYLQNNFDIVIIVNRSSYIEIWGIEG